MLACSRRRTGAHRRTLSVRAAESTHACMHARWHVLQASCGLLGVGIDPNHASTDADVRTRPAAEDRSVPATGEVPSDRGRRAVRRPRRSGRRARLFIAGRRARYTGHSLDRSKRGDGVVSWTQRACVLKVYRRRKHTTIASDPLVRRRISFLLTQRNRIKPPQLTNKNSLLPLVSYINGCTNRTSSI